MAKNELQRELMEIIDTYLEEESEVIEEVFDSVGKTALEKIKSSSPRGGRRGGYADSWALDKSVNGTTGIDMKIYNKKHPGLTHLLENGHVVRNQYGSPSRAGAKTRVSGQPHIGAVQDWVDQELLRELKGKL